MLTSLGTLNDTDIEALCATGILIDENFDNQRIKQACYELRCGTVYYCPIENNKRYDVPKDEFIVLQPFRTIVIITLESLNLPADILGRVMTKGVLFSLGVVPVNTYADPGFSGKLGIVMTNISNNYIKLPPGEPLAKIEFSKLQFPVAKPYKGQHGYQSEIWPYRSDLILTEDEKRNMQLVTI